MFYFYIKVFNFKNNNNFYIRYNNSYILTLKSNSFNFFFKKKLEYQKTFISSNFKFLKMIFKNKK